MSQSSDAPDWVKAWMASARNPYLFATGVLGFLPFGAPNPEGVHQLEKWQDEFLREFYTGPDGTPCADPRHSVRAGHGVGKGVVIAILALWFPLTHHDSKAVLSGCSQDQLRDNNWPEIRKWYAHLPLELREQLQIDEERLFVKAAPEMAFVVRRTASAANPEALQGIHALHTMYLVDEASGIIDVVFEIAQGSLSTAGAVAVLFSNPTRRVGFFFDTHNKLRHRWRTWRVNCEDVPRARGHIQDVIDAYGKDSNKYRVRVLGEFPTSDDDVVMRLEIVEAARNRDVVPTESVLPYWGVDVGRFGDDSSALAKRKGNVLLEPVAEWKNKDTMQTAGIIHRHWRDTPEHLRPAAIFVDVIGIGAGVVDRLKEMELPAVGVNVAESASNDERYVRLRDELWFKGKEWFASKDCTIPVDEKLVSELTTVTFDYASNGKLVVQSKKDMRKDGIASPNKADAFLLTFYMPDRRRARRDRYRPESSASSWAA